MSGRDSRTVQTSQGAAPSAGDSAPIEQALRRRIETGGKALVPFLTAEFPDRDTFVALLREVRQSGCDAVEVGMPFSDPIADGPTIQHAGEQSLAAGTTIRSALDAIAAAELDIPVILMGYLNPLLAYGAERFVADARAAGVRGLIIPDLPLDDALSQRSRDVSSPAERSRDVSSPAERRRDVSSRAGRPHDLWLDPLSENWERILLAAPTTTDARLRRIGRATRGFLYAVTVAGVTGARTHLPPETVEFLDRARQATTKPVLAGFGISDAGTAATVAAHCDGVIVGSALIDRIRNGPKRGAIRRAGRFLRELRGALDTASA